MSSSRSTLLRFFAAILVSLGCIVSAEADVVLSFGALPGKRSESRIFSAGEDGCYAFKIEGADGASLSVVDRMYGEIAALSASGDPSAEDGRAARTTVFLERGEYKLVLGKPEKSSAGLSVERFGVSEAPRAAADGAERKLTLSDGRSIGFTVRVDAADPYLRFFAAGRSLGGAKLFRSGLWAADGEARAGVYELENGRPSRWIEFNEEVEPGEYRIVCWGAPALPWSGDGPADALFVFEGERRADEIGRVDLSLGASGLAFLTVPGSTSFAQATVSGGGLALSWSAPDGPRLAFRSTARSGDRGGYRTATLRMSSSSGLRRLVLHGAPGGRVGLRFFPAARTGAFASEIPGGNASASAAVRALGAVEGEDSVPLTARAFLLEGSGRSIVSRENGQGKTIVLSSSRPIRLSANLLERNSFLVDVAESGSYAVLERESKKGGDQKAAGRWTFYPVNGFSFDKTGAKSAERGESVELDAGGYLLVVEALSPGPLDALVAREGIATKLGGLALWNAESDGAANGFSWYGVELPARDASARAALALGERSGVVQGVSVRAEPIDLAERPFAVALEAGQSARFRVVLSRPSLLRSSDGRLRATVDGAALNEAAVYPAGERVIGCEAADGKALWAVLEARAASEALQPARYDSVREGAPFWTEFERGETKRFLLRVDAPAFYALSTTGRLDTRISLRSRMRPSLESASDGGPGRNARVAAYLKAGDYLVEVGVEGASRGAAGISLERRPLRELPPLIAEGRVRATAAAGEALYVPFRTDADGVWSVSSLGLGRSFAFRLEDSLGWPIGPNVGDGGYSGYLAAGSYRFISLDDRVDTRRVFTLAAVESAPASGRYTDAGDALAKRGKLEFGRSYEREWRGEGPDELSIELPAPVSATMSLSDDMAYRVRGPDGETLAAGLGSRSISLTLPSGLVTVGFTPLLEDQDHGYSVRIDCPDLLEGRPLKIGPGSVVPLSVGRAGVWELETSGGEELEAALFVRGPNGYALAATSRPIADDWNCVLSAPLEPGRYLVKFASPGDPRLSEVPVSVPTRTASGPSSVAARFRANAEPLRRKGAFSLSAEVGSDFAVVDFSPEKDGPYRLSADAADAAELYLERAGKLVAYGRGALMAVLSGGAEYRLRCGRSGEGRSRVALSGAPAAFAEVSVGASGEIESKANVLRLRDPKRLSRFSAASGFLLASGADASFRPAGSEPFPADGAWLARADGAAVGRVVLPPAVAGALSLPLYPEGQRVSVPVPEGSIALLEAASRGFEVSLTEAGAGGNAGVSAVDWSASAVSGTRTVLGLASGDRTVSVRDSRSDPDGRLVPVSAEVLPVLRRVTASVGSESTIEIGARSAVAVSADRGAARLSLEGGLAAFVSGGRTALTVEAYEGSGSFELGDLPGILYIANPGSRAAVASLALSSAREPSLPALREDSPWEALLVRSGRTTLRVDGREGSLAAAGSVRSFRFYDEESGRVVSGERVETPSGTLLVAPGRRGKLVLEADAGYAAVFLTQPELRAASMAGSPPRGALEPIGAGKEFGGAEGKRYTIEHSGGPALLAAAASGDGALAIIGPDGAAIAAAAAAGLQTAVAGIDAPGVYTVAVRPVSGRSRAGSVRAEILRPERVERSGALDERIAAPGRVHAYRFAVAAETLVGVGLRAERDGLSARLLDAAFRTVGEGAALIRKLAPGDYYLLVSSDEGSARYRPVFFGIEGTRAEVPEAVAAEYLRNGEE